MSTELRFVKLSINASAPTRGSTRAAGFDLKRQDILYLFCVILYQNN